MDDIEVNEELLGSLPEPPFKPEHIGKIVVIHSYRRLGDVELVSNLCGVLEMFGVERDRYSFKLEGVPPVTLPHAGNILIVNVCN